MNNHIEDMAEVIRNTWLPIMQGDVTVGETHISDYDAIRIAETLYKAGYKKPIEGTWTLNDEHIKQSEWLWQGTRCFCSTCNAEDGIKQHYEDGTVDLYPWCPNCGAKMKEN